MKAVILAFIMFAGGFALGHWFGMSSEHKIRIAEYNQLVAKYNDLASHDINIQIRDDIDRQAAGIERIPIVDIPRELLKAE